MSFDDAARHRRLYRSRVINNQERPRAQTARILVVDDHSVVREVLAEYLSLDGYQVWADALKPIFTELLGPPAAIDHAPPPTGDPSASAAPTGDPNAAQGGSPTR